MSVIKGVEKLKGILSDQEIAQLNKAASTHKKFSNIHFEIDSMTLEHSLEYQKHKSIAYGADWSAYGTLV